METSSSSSSSSKKLKQTMVVSHDIMEIGDENETGDLVTEEDIDVINMGKATEVTNEEHWENHLTGLLVPTSSADDNLMDVVPPDPLIDSEPESENPDNLDDESFYDYEELSDEDFSYYDETLSLQAQFDAADLPPGVEAPIPWLEQPAKSDQKSAATSSSAASTLSSSSNGKGKKDEVEIMLQQLARSQNLTATSSSTVPGPSNSAHECEEDSDDQVFKNFRLFKRFDTVQDFSDHHFCQQSCKSKQALRGWSKAIQQEWKILEKNLPDTIFVRTCEERMDLLRAAIIGVAGTPYHDGLFFFDFLFPSSYPKLPPQVYYYSGGLRLNPNLYDCGKVCLSLLNTWHGSKSEQWTPGKSTVLQVLLSIQALVLNAKPFFNEPGYERMAGDKVGEKKAKDYNENTFILSCKTMLYTLRRPPKHFEDFVVGHFRQHANAILEACEAYTEGAPVGCAVGSVQDVSEADSSSSQKFKWSVGEIAASLVPAFIENGAKDCEKFIPLGDIYRKAPLKKEK